MSYGGSAQWGTWGPSSRVSYPTRSNTCHTPDPKLDHVARKALGVGVGIAVCGSVSFCSIVFDCLFVCLLACVLACLLDWMLVGFLVGSLVA